MKKAIFIFSSPLQFLFSTLISQKLDKDYIIKGYYYNFGKDFSSVYTEISNYLNSPITDVDLFKNLDVNSICKDDFVFFGNRYQTDEINLFRKLKRNVENLYLYEEGFNIYIKHHFNDVMLSEFNVKTSIKNIVKIFIGKSPSLIKLSEFSGIYSTFSIEHLEDQSKWRKIEFIQTGFERNNYPNSCLFLSQSLVEDGLVDESIYLSFMNLIINKLSKEYETIYFKPHPRNEDSLTNAILSNNCKIKLLPVQFKNMPAEVFLTKNKVDLYAFSSSTLMYASTLLKINSFQCLDSLLTYASTTKLINLKKASELIFTKHNVKTFI